MPSAGRLHLLLAFAIFFAVVHAPVRRPAAPPTAAGFPEACSFDSADRSTDQELQDPGREAHDGPVALAELSVVPSPAGRPSSVLELNAVRGGRRVGFGDTPPPRAA